MTLRLSLALLHVFHLLAVGRGAKAPTPSPPSMTWRLLAPGVELAVVPGLGKAAAPAARFEPLYVVRVDPGRAKVRPALASESRSRLRTAGEWCRTAKLAVAINLGMYQQDGRSNVGYLRHGTHSNNGRWNDYRAVLALGPPDGSLPAALWHDMTPPALDPRLSRYDLVVQNLRLIAGPRRNVWSQSAKRWSEAAIAFDAQGRLLFLFSRAPSTMHDFNEGLLRLPLDVVAAMHVEGGPEASLSIHVPGLDLDLAGSYETGFFPNEGNDHQWPIPNVLGIVLEEAPAKGSPPAPAHGSRPGVRTSSD